MIVSAGLCDAVTLTNILSVLHHLAKRVSHTTVGSFTFLTCPRWPYEINEMTVKTTVIMDYVHVLSSLTVMVEEKASLVISLFKVMII